MTDDAVSHRLVLIDGSSLAYRAYFALPETIATREGFPTNALYGFGQMLLKIVSEFRPAALLVAWDAREKTFRHEEYEEYKAQRPHMPEPLSQQWPHLPELVSAFGITNLVLPGYEADDILGTLAETAKREGVRSLVVTGDRDALQIVDDDVWVVTTGRGVTDVKVYTPAKVVERYGITPDKVPDYIGLKGDSSDNIPGVRGVGEKTAAALIQQFGSVEAIYERLDEVASEKRRALLTEHEQEARLSKRLATMVLDVPLDEDVVGLVSRRDYELPVDDVAEVFKRFEFTSLVRRVRELGRGSGEEAAGRGAPARRLLAPPGGRGRRRRAGRDAREGRGGAGVRRRREWRHGGGGPRRGRRRSGSRRSDRRAGVGLAGGRPRRRPRREVAAGLHNGTAGSGLRHRRGGLSSGARADGARPVRSGGGGA
jgi:DNA polymerase-1